MTMTKSAVARVVMAAVAMGLFAGCDAERDDDGELRQIEQQLEDVAEAQANITGDIEACANDYATCLEETLGDLDACSPAFDECFADLPGAVEPEVPEIPEIPEDFGGACVDDLWTCIDGGGDPITCAAEAEGCIEGEVTGICDAAYDACIAAGAGASTCDIITASCVIP